MSIVSMQSSSKTSEIDKHKTSEDDKHNNRYKIPSNKNTINEHALTSSYNAQYFMYNHPITGHCHPPLNEMVTSCERIYSDTCPVSIHSFLHKHPVQTSSQCTNVHLLMFWVKTVFRFEVDIQIPYPRERLGWSPSAPQLPCMERGPPCLDCLHRFCSGHPNFSVW